MITARRDGTDAVLTIPRDMAPDHVAALLDLSIETLLAEGRLDEAILLARDTGMDLTPTYLDPMPIDDEDARRAVEWGEWCEHHGC